MSSTAGNVEIMTIREVADYLKVTERTIYRLLSAKSLTGTVFKQFDRIYGPRAATQDWLRMPDRSSRCDEVTEEQRLEKIKEFKN